MTEWGNLSRDYMAVSTGRRVRYPPGLRESDDDFINPPLDSEAIPDSSSLPAQAPNSINITLPRVSYTRNIYSTTGGSGGNALWASGSSSTAALPALREDYGAEKDVLSEEALAELEEHTHEGESEKCPVDHEEIKEGDPVIKLRCGHIFRPPAIRQWLGSFAATCPVCRARVTTAPPETPRRYTVVHQPVAVERFMERSAEVNERANYYLMLAERLRSQRFTESRRQTLTRVIASMQSELADLGPPIHTTTTVVFSPGEMTHLTQQFQTLAGMLD